METRIKRANACDRLNSLPYSEAGGEVKSHQNSCEPVWSFFLMLDGTFECVQRSICPGLLNADLCDKGRNVDRLERRNWQNLSFTISVQHSREEFVL